jgi:hypothetical protein
MKPMGILLSMIGFILGSTAVVIHIEAHTVVSPISYGGLACTLALFIFWTAWCGPGWVKLAADAYAERLLAAPDALGLAAPTPKKATRKAKSPAKEK